MAKKEKEVVSSKDFSFTVETKNLASVLKLAATIVPPNVDGTHYVLESVDGSMNVWAFNDIANIRLKLEAEPDGDGIIGFNSVALQGAVKGRNTLIFEKVNTVLKFKATKGPYNGELVTLPITQESFDNVKSLLSVDKSEKKSAMKIDDDLLADLKEGLAVTALNAVHAADPIETFIRVAKGKLEVTVCDSFHLANFVKNVKSEISLQLSVPKSHFDTLARMAAEYAGMKKTASLYMGSDLIKAIHPAYAIALPAAQSKESNFDKAQSLIKDLPKANGSFTAKKNEFSKVLSNLQSVYEEGSSVSVASVNKKGKDLLQLSIKTMHGTVEDSQHISEKSGKDFKIKLDPRMLNDFLRVYKNDTVQFEVITGTAYTIRYKGEFRAIYVGSLVGD